MFDLNCSVPLAVELHLAPEAFDNIHDLCSHLPILCHIVYIVGIAIQAILASADTVSRIYLSKSNPPHSA